MNQKAARLTPEQALTQLEALYENRSMRCVKPSAIIFTIISSPRIAPVRKDCSYTRSCRCRGTERNIKR
ncbi:AMP nucleosidase [Klebsiella michiganensis]|uniref:AMP nucleosidase n=1 Tax=Klebsiella michiganensis TaxID=1134687 RepID=A0A7H4MVW0_9ENTR|nr:AMP nucleosidase [Klebsiella michiganensis]